MQRWKLRKQEASMQRRKDANVNEIFQGAAAVFGLNRPLGAGRRPRSGAAGGPANGSGAEPQARDVVAAAVEERAPAPDEIGDEPAQADGEQSEAERRELP